MVPGRGSRFRQLHGASLTELIASDNSAERNNPGARAPGFSLQASHCCKNSTSISLAKIRCPSGGSVSLALTAISPGRFGDGLNLKSFFHLFVKITHKRTPTEMTDEAICSFLLHGRSN